MALGAFHQVYLGNLPRCELDLGEHLGDDATGAGGIRDVCLDHHGSTK